MAGNADPQNRSEEVIDARGITRALKISMKKTSVEV